MVSSLLSLKNFHFQIIILFLIVHVNKSSKSVAPVIRRAKALFDASEQAYGDESHDDEEVNHAFNNPKRPKTKTTETGTVAVAENIVIVPDEHQ